MQSRDGLLRMYQKLLVEKEQRLRDVIQAKRYVRVLGPFEGKVVGRRSWRALMALSRLKHRLQRRLARFRDTRG